MTNYISTGMFVILVISPFLVIMLIILYNDKRITARYKKGSLVSVIRRGIGNITHIYRYRGTILYQVDTVEYLLRESDLFLIEDLVEIDYDKK